MWGIIFRSSLTISSSLFCTFSFSYLFNVISLKFPLLLANNEQRRNYESVWIYFNPFSAERRYIVVWYTSEKCQRRYIVAHALAYLKITFKHVKMVQIRCNTIEKKCLLDLTSCYIFCWLVPRLCICWSDKVETGHGIVSWDRNRNLYDVYDSYQTAQVTRRALTQRDWNLSFTLYWPS